MFNISDYDFLEKSKRRKLALKREHVLAVIEQNKLVTLKSKHQLHDTHIKYGLIEENPYDSEIIRRCNFKLSSITNRRKKINSMIETIEQQEFWYNHVGSQIYWQKEDEI